MLIPWRIIRRRTGAQGLLLVVVLLWLLAACSRNADPPAQAPAAAPAATPAATTPTPAAAPTASAPAPDRVFGPEQLEQMVAPVALYPDPLLAQVLMAATYPGEVADAVAWSKAHPKSTGDAAVKEVASTPWDASVQSLVAFPQVLATLGQDPAWVQSLGDAFLAQPEDVMAAVQRLRGKAQAAGNLASNQYQQVTVQPAAAAPAPVSGGDAGGTVESVAAPAQTIVIEPADPAVVYVPSYNPTTVYGAWSYPSYPPAYYPPSPGYYAGSALAAGLAFGVGVAITDSLWGGFDWGHDDIDIDVNRYNNINVNRRMDVNNNTWRHDPVHRNGVPYRDHNSREQFGRQLDGAAGREAFRGDDPARAQARDRARNSMERSGIGAPARDNQQARERAHAAAERGGVRDQAAAGAARDRAAGGAARDRAAAGDGGRAQAAQRAQQSLGQRGGAGEHDRAAAAQRAQNARNHPGAAGNRAQGQAHAPVQHRQTQGNNQQVRQAARQQPSRQQAHNNAFQGASRPSASHAQAQRGHHSQAAASRPQASRSSGRPVQRPSHPPQRQAPRRH